MKTNTAPEGKMDDGGSKMVLRSILHPLSTILAALLLTLCTGHAADVKTSALSALTAPATGDLLRIVDVSDTSSAATGTTKKITLVNLSTILTPTWANIASKPVTLAGLAITGGATLDTLGGLLQTGTGKLVLDTSPVLVTPALGAATATSLVSAGAVTAGGTLTASGDVVLTKTITAAGVTGAQTINKTSGTVNFAAAATTLVVTNSLALTTSIIHLQVEGADATATTARVTKAAGSFTITLDAAATAETAVSFTVTN